MLTTLKTVFSEVTIVYLDAQDSVLLRRFNETRRKHPLQTTTTSLQEALVQERRLLEPLQQSAQLRIDTSSLSVHQLKKF